MLNGLPAISGTIAALIAPWGANCEPALKRAAASCEPPQATTPNVFLVTAPLKPVWHPGEADFVVREFKDVSQDGKPIEGVMSVYSVYPHENSGNPPYIQVKLELIRPARAVCAQSVRWKAEHMEAPPMICAGFSGAGDRKQSGATVRFEFAVPGT